MNKVGPGVLILGMHRSGTSALAGALGMCGAWLGQTSELTTSNAENPKGFWERRDMRAVCDKLLHAAGDDWWKVSGFDPAAVPHAALDEQGRIFRTIVRELQMHGAWAVKEPRLCLLLPLLRGWMENAAPVCIHIYRNPLEVAYSLRERNGFGIAEGLALWEAYNLSALRASADLPRLLVSYHELIARPRDTLAVVLDKLADFGVSEFSLPEDEELAAFITLELHRHRREAEEAEAFLLPSQRELWARLENAEALQVAPDAALSPVTKQYLHDLESRQSALVEREAQCSQLSTKVTGLNNQVEKTESKLVSRENRLRALEQQLELQHQDAVEFQDRLARLDAKAKERAEQLQMQSQQLKEQSRGISGQRACIKDLKAYIEARDTTIIKLTARFQHFRTRARALAEQQTTSDAQAQKLASALDSQRAQTRHHQDRAEAATHEVDKLKSSSSWRITRPARFVSRTAKRQVGNARRTLVMTGRLIRGQFSRALAGSFSFCRRRTPSWLKVLVPTRVREAIKSRLGRRGADMKAHGKFSQDSRKLPTPEVDSTLINKRLTVAVIAWDVGHNPLGRAYLIAEALSRYFHVVLLGPAFSRFGGCVWEPLEQADIPVIPLPGADFPELAQTFQTLAKRIRVDTVIACKPRLPSLLLGHLIKAAQDLPLFIDIDDWEPAFTKRATPMSLKEVRAQLEDEILAPHSDSWTCFG